MSLASTLNVTLNSTTRSYNPLLVSAVHTIGTDGKKFVAVAPRNRRRVTDALRAGS